MENITDSMMEEHYEWAKSRGLGFVSTKYFDSEYFKVIVEQDEELLNDQMEGLAEDYAQEGAI